MHCMQLKVRCEGEREKVGMSVRVGREGEGEEGGGRGNVSVKPQAGCSVKLNISLSHICTTYQIFAPHLAQTPTLTITLIHVRLLLHA